MNDFRCNVCGYEWSDVVFVEDAICPSCRMRDCYQTYEEDDDE